MRTCGGWWWRSRWDELGFSEFLLEEELLLGCLLPECVLHSLLLLQLKDRLCIRLWFRKLALLRYRHSSPRHRIINRPSMLTLIELLNILNSLSFLLFLLKQLLRFLLLPFLFLLRLNLLSCLMISDQLVDFMLHVLLSVLFILILARDIVIRLLLLVLLQIHRVGLCAESPLSLEPLDDAPHLYVGYDLGH